MITDLFTVESGIVKPTIHCYIIPQFKKIVEEYPANHVAMLAYCFYLTCPYKSENPYADLNEEEKENRLKLDFFVFPDNQDVLDATVVMRKLYETRASRYLTKNRKNLEDIMDYIDSAPIIDGKDGNLDQRIKVAEKCAKIMSEYTQLEEQAEEEKNKLKTRANRKLGLGEL